MRNPRTFFYDSSESDVSALCVTSKNIISSSCLSWPMKRFHKLSAFSVFHFFNRFQTFQSFESSKQNRPNIKNIVSHLCLCCQRAYGAFNFLCILLKYFTFMYNEIQNELKALKSSLKHDVMRYGVLSRQLECEVLKVFSQLTVDRLLCCMRLTSTMI